MTLEAHGVSVRYSPESAPALLDVSVGVERGEVLGLIGPNGSGKSTLLRTMAGILAPSDGGIRLDDDDVAGLGRAARARAIGYLPQRIEPPPSMTAIEIALQGRYPHLYGLGLARPADVEAARAALERLAVAELAERRIDSLSGGERQRVFLASILAQRADYLLLDEPTNALDLHHQSSIFSMLRRLAEREGLGIAVAIHDLTLAGARCDRIALLSHGRCVAIGIPDNVLNESCLVGVYGESIRVDRHPRWGTPFVWVEEEDAGGENEC